ncbi:hypothetical protein [Nonomuraea zeae]|uniref:Uncharacterized protein n=1 Tax=Nonomuraea zeae TaxID=1642303 RepID=A0A5S4H3A0_9ACTN|nr:hypothetical protein [Nonomuraea zeae]TMR39576.1 hypothetical protein ETD85_00760 [Nonomuraea zeae]
MRAIALIFILAVGGNALTITPALAVLLVAVGVLLAVLACAVIVGVVRLAGVRPGRLLNRNGGGHGQSHSDR